MKHEIKILIFGFNRHSTLIRLIEKLHSQHGVMPVTLYLDGPRVGNLDDKVQQDKILNDLSNYNFIEKPLYGDYLFKYK